MEWVLSLATDLVNNSVDVKLDRWDLKPGNDVDAYMEQMVTEPDIKKVIMICDHLYAEKADGRKGGVGTETQIITPNIYEKEDQSKFVAVLTERDGDGKPCLPAYCRGRLFIDMSDPELYPSSFAELLHWIFDVPPHAKPALGTKPSFLRDSEEAPSLEPSAKADPILGVDIKDSPTPKSIQSALGASKSEPLSSLDPEETSTEDEEKRIARAKELQRTTAPDAQIAREIYSIEFVWIPPGSFTMGSNDGRSDDKPTHRVTISKGFWMGKYAVTRGEWQSVMGGNLSHRNSPMGHISWEDCQAFIKKLNRRVRWKCRLPTEAEWEYACRAGSSTPYGFGYSHSRLSLHAGHSSYIWRHNAWGLYDMHGNVSEWCSDRYREYTNASVTDPKGAVTGSSRVLRGGAWCSNPEHCRSASRARATPADSPINFGFRLCCSSDE